MSTIKTRYAEFTKGDENWEIIRRWAEIAEELHMETVLYFYDQHGA